MASGQHVEESGKTKAARFFDSRKDEWQHRSENADDYWSRRINWATQFVAKELAKPARCLDIGCATGLFAEHLHRQGYDVYGVDISEAMVQGAQNRMAAFGVPADHFAICDTDILPFQDETFDFLSALDVLPYVEDQPKYLEELHRILKPGALALVNNVNRGSLFIKRHLTYRLFTCIPGGRYIVPGKWWWRQTYNLIRTGYWSGGFVNISKAVQARSADALDRFFMQAGFQVLGGFDTYNIRRLDRDPLRRKGWSAWAARRWAWNHFGLYAKPTTI
jgi:ubiquinone/menaquinone biosynthesis C-methylase UbiE